jgi:tyrosine decarboxylase / aspartate 1-decarboxylase
MPPPTPFPEQGLPEESVLASVQEHLKADPYETAKNFGISYVGPPHPIAAKAAQIAAETVFVDWASDMFPGTQRLEKEAVRMVGSLLGASDPAGFITSGGTESNMLAVRLARDLAGKTEPEMVMPETAHFSFRLGAELFGIRIRSIPVGDDLRPDMSGVESLLNRNTVALICSAPEGHLGVLDPVEEFSRLAERTGIYLHVDAAFGGFILPFMRELEYPIPPFDFGLPGVRSMMTDGHKLGLLPVATGFFIVRDRADLQALPTEETLIHTLTSTKPGGNAAAAWAVISHLGKEGYRQYVRDVLDVVRIICEGVERIPGLRLVVPPLITVVNITSDTLDVEKVYSGLRRRGWGTTFGEVKGRPHIRLSIHPRRDRAHAEGFVRALEESARDARGG